MYIYWLKNRRERESYGIRDSEWNVKETDKDLIENVKVLKNEVPREMN